MNNIYCTEQIVVTHDTFEVVLTSSFVSPELLREALFLFPNGTDVSLLRFFTGEFLSV